MGLKVFKIVFKGYIVGDKLCLFGGEVFVGGGY